MKLFKILLISLVLVLSGCSTLSSVFSGNFHEEIVLDKDGKVKTTMWGTPIKLKTKETQAAAISRDSKDALIAITNLKAKQLELEIAQLNKESPQSGCYPLSEQQVGALHVGAQTIYLQESAVCAREAKYTSVIAVLSEALKSLTKGDSDLVGVAKEYGATIRSVAAEGTRKLQAIMNPLQNVGLAIQVKETIQSGNEAIRDVGIFAAENAGDINATVNTSQTASTSSNDGESGELGSSTGTGGGSLDASKEGDTILIGRDIAQASDNAAAFNDVRNAQNLAESATGAINEDVNIDQQPIIDENNAELINSPSFNSDTTETSE